MILYTVKQRPCGCLVSVSPYTGKERRGFAWSSEKHRFTIMAAEDSATLPELCAEHRKAPKQAQEGLFE